MIQIKMEIPNGIKGMAIDTYKNWYYLGVNRAQRP
jgi:hypothetical protein